MKTEIILKTIDIHDMVKELITSGIVRTIIK